MGWACSTSATDTLTFSAGHPVLGAAAVLHTLLPAAEPEENWALAVAQRTVDVQTRGADRWVDATMDQGVAKLGPAITGEMAEAYRDALNLARGQLHPALPMQVVSTGLPYLIVPVQSGLESAGIRHPGFEGLLDASGAKFVYVLDPDRPEGRTWDNAGRVEEVATGSAPVATTRPWPVTSYVGHGPGPLSGWLS